MVRFLIDENIPKSVVTWLKDQGYDAIRAQDVGLGGSADSELANWSLENETMILTLDEDFDQLRHKDKAVGIIKPLSSGNPCSLDIEGARTGKYK